MSAVFPFVSSFPLFSGFNMRNVFENSPTSNAFKKKSPANKAFLMTASAHPHPICTVLFFPAFSQTNYTKKLSVFPRCLAATLAQMNVQVPDKDSLELEL